MDGSDVTVVVLGREEVGKNTFISHSLELFKSDVKDETTSTVHICGRDVRVKMIRNPEKPMSARVVIVLMDLTDQHALQHLPASLQLSQKLCPSAAPAVVGTKADLYRNRKIATEDAVSFCESWPQDTGPLPYYETGLDPPDSIVFAFQEILARPLIDDYLKVTTEPDLSTFVHTAMDWCLDNGSANLLTHLRSIGHSIPSPLFDKHAVVLSEYFLHEHPPVPIPEFKKNDLTIAPEPVSLEDSLDEPEEPMEVVDRRPSISVASSYLLPWRNLSLAIFLGKFLKSHSLPASALSHVDLAHNQLADLPLEIFHLPALKSLNVSHNRLTSLPPIERWGRGSTLQYLNASHNLLTGGANSLPHKRGSADISVPYAGEVWNMDLSHNDFCGFPNWVLRYSSLRILDLSGNPQIHTLPTQLTDGRMPYLTSLSVDPDSLHDPPPSVARGGPADILHYLQLKRQASQVWNCLRVVVVGPQGAGKSQLVAKIKEDKMAPLGPTKGLEVTEWKHRGSDFFSFKTKQVTIDFWDFSGDPSYHIIYSCFNCSLSLHLVVCAAHVFNRQELLHWLADIQATSVERIPVVIVFTHCDKFTSREQKDTFRKDVVHWLSAWERCVLKGRIHALPTISQSIKNLNGDEINSSVESQSTKDASTPDDQESSSSEDLPLLPVVHRVFFVNALTGDGVSSLRKCLIKIASGSLAQELAGFSGFQLIGREIPTVYHQVETMVRTLRERFRNSRREGEQRPFYTVSELMDKKLKRALSESGLEQGEFEAALNFLHEYGFVYLHECRERTTTLVSVDPQLVGYLLQRMIRAGLVTQEVNSTSCYLPNSHIFMLWGVEPIWSLELEQGADAIFSHHLLDYLYNLNLCSPLISGLTLLPSLLPAILPPLSRPSPSPSLQCRRVYFFGYLPVHFFSQLIARVVTSFLKITGGLPSPISPGQVPPSTTSIPFEMQAGLMLFVWKKNLFLKDEDGSQLLVKLLDGEDVCPSAVPHEARVDVLLAAPPETEAKWLHVVTTEMDYLLEHTYPALVHSEFSGQLVEILVPVPFVFEEDGHDKVLNGGDAEVVEGEGREEGEGEGERERWRGGGRRGDGEGEGGEERWREGGVEGGRSKRANGGSERGGSECSDVEKDGVAGGEDSVFTDDASPLQVYKTHFAGEERGGEGEGELEGRRRRREGGVPLVGSVASYASSLSSPRQRLLFEHTHETTSWEVLSKRSSTSTRFSIKTDCTASHFFVPVWECLRAAFKSPMVRLKNRKLCLKHVIPDLLFGDLPAEFLLRTPEYSGVDRADRQRNDGVATGRLQNGVKTVSKWNGVGTSMRKPLRLQSNGTSASSQGRPFSGYGNLTQPHSIQNGIGPHMFGQTGTQPSISTSGLHVKSYYTSSEEEECGGREGGASRMLCLKKCLQKARDDLNKLRRLQCPYIVSAIGVHYSPPSLAVESSPCGSLHRLLREERRGLVEIGSNTIHHILLQLLSALEYFHQEGLNYHTLRSDNVLLWCMDPISIKLSDSGITHMSHGCELCSYIKAVPSKLKKTQTATRIDYMLLGLLIYEIATGIQPYEHVYDLGTVALALLHKKLKINVEAELNNNGNNKCRKTSQRAVSCHRMCMQSSMEECIVKERLAATLLKARLSLCGGNHEWSPMRLTLNPECVLCSGENDLIYWASGSRGLVMGTLDISTGSLNSNILQEAPRPESGLFAHRRGKPVPIAVGRATALTLVEETQQLWVGTENGSSGSVYVFKLPDMRRHHYIRLQDAVLSLVALNKISVRYGGDEMKYRVLVGLANGTIIQFIGVHKDKILENPLQGPRVVVHLVDHKPCIAMQLTAQGHLWCSSGNSVEVLDAVTLRGIRKLPLTMREEGKEHVLKKNDVITLMSINRYGVWTVGRRSPILRLWNQESGNFIASYDIHTVLTESGDDITAMAVQGGGVWLGTRNGFIFLLDAAAVLEKRGVAHLGLQHCGEGRVKNIVPLVAAREVLAKLEVFCSLEYPDEVSGAVMTWQFQCQQEWRPRPTGARRHSDPLPTPDDPPPPPLSSQPAST